VAVEVRATPLANKIIEELPAGRVVLAESARSRGLTLCEFIRASAVLSADVTADEDGSR
jgi:hypothetical protein